ncbi:MAG: hypothetical protein DRP29_09895, partial [Thermodesulfobacteriota bacterium]
MEQKTYKIRINLQNGEIEVEGDKEFVETEIKTLLEEFQKLRKVYASLEESAQLEKEQKSILKEKKPYIKEFVKEKNPSTAQETAVVLAYYLKEYERKETFNAEDIKKIWTASGWKPPKKIWQSVIDGKNRYQWFEEVSRGEYKISPHGIYFVENELPKKIKE